MREDWQQVISEHGQLVVPVVSPHPLHQPFTYTVGRYGRGLPELLLFSQGPKMSGWILNELDDREGSGATDLRPGVEVPDMLDASDGTLPVRIVGPCTPVWAELYGRQCFVHYDRQADEIPFLQVLVPDLEGHFPGDPGYGHHWSWFQPDLTHPTRPFATAFDPWDFGWPTGFPPPRDDIGVEVPIVVDGEFQGSYELVRTRHLERDRYEVTRPAVFADWVRVGSVLRAEPGLLREVLEPAERVALAWQWHGDEDGDGAVALAAAAQVAELPGCGVTVNGAVIRVDTAPDQHDAVEAAFRPATRDGIIHPLDSYSDPAHVCTDPHCTH